MRFTGYGHRDDADCSELMWPDSKWIPPPPEFIDFICQISIFSQNWHTVKKYGLLGQRASKLKVELLTGCNYFT